jgi:ABC-type branched-subunit amino acid transport system ATPase component
MTDRNHENILTVKNLSKRFGRVEVLKNIKLSLGLGEIYAIIGPNGAGKTTLFNLVTGIIEKDSGAVTYYNGKVVHGKLVSGGVVSGKLVSGEGWSGRMGKENVVNGNQVNERLIDITKFKPHQVARLGIGRTFQGNRVFGNMTVLENVMFAKQLIEIENPIALMKTNHKKLLKELNDKNNLGNQEKEATNLEAFLKKEAEYWLDFVGLKEKAENKAEELSYGQQKLLSIARLLMADSRLLLFDEPTAGVNPKYSVRIAEIFRKIIAKRDKTILFIEHDMKFIQRLGCKCLYMEEGKCPWPFYELEVIMKNPDIRRKFMGM